MWRSRSLPRVDWNLVLCRLLDLQFTCRYGRSSVDGVRCRRILWNKPRDAVQMTERTRLIDENEVEEIRQLLRNRGVRATPARIAVLQELRKARSPLTHADLAEHLVPLGF